MERNALRTDVSEIKQEQVVETKGRKRRRGRMKSEGWKSVDEKKDRRAEKKGCSAEGINRQEGRNKA